jgi:hypothetical protein
MTMLLGTPDVPVDDRRIRGLTLFDMFLIVSGKTQHFSGMSTTDHGTR